MRLIAVPRRAFLACLVLGAMSLVAINGCSDDDDDDNPVNPGTPSTQLTGVFLGETDGGKISITIPLASTALAPRLGGSAPVTATGTLSPVSGGTINLTGAYDAETDILALTGGAVGSEYTFGGQYEPGSGPITGITGEYTGPNGPGGFAAAVGGSGTVSTYCGTYTSSFEGSGNLNLIIVGTTVAGGVATGGTLYGFEGTVTGTAPNQTITIDDEVEPGIVVAAAADLNATTGVISNGRYAIINGGTETDSGAWQGSTSCSTPPAN